MSEEGPELSDFLDSFSEGAEGGSEAGSFPGDLSSQWGEICCSLVDAMQKIEEAVFQDAALKSEGLSINLVIIHHRMSRQQVGTFRPIASAPFQCVVDQPPSSDLPL